MQQGTFQDAAHFNSIEEGMTANELALNLLINFARQNKWDAEAFELQHATVHGELDGLIDALNQSVERLHSVETGTKTLTNTSRFPFNNSQQTVALATTRDTSCANMGTHGCGQSPLFRQRPWFPSILPRFRRGSPQ